MSRGPAHTSVAQLEEPRSRESAGRAALCLELRASIWTLVYPPKIPNLARTFCAQNRPIPIRDRRQLHAGWARLAGSMRFVPTISLDFSRSNASGRSDLHSPKDAWTSQTHDLSGILQNQRGMNAAPSPFRQNATLASQRPVARGFASRSTGLAGRVRHYTSTLKIRARTRAFRGPGDRQALIFRQESEGGIRRRIRRQRSRAARADGTDVWARNRRSEQPARRERDWAAHTIALGTADAAKWANRQETCLAQPRGTISMSRTNCHCGRPNVEAAGVGAPRTHENLGRSGLSFGEMSALERLELRIQECKLLPDAIYLVDR